MENNAEAAVPGMAHPRNILEDSCSEKLQNYSRKYKWRRPASFEKSFNKHQ